MAVLPTGIKLDQLSIKGKNNMIPSHDQTQGSVFGKPLRQEEIKALPPEINRPKTDEEKKADQQEPKEGFFRKFGKMLKNMLSPKPKVINT